MLLFREVEVFAIKLKRGSYRLQTHRRGVHIGNFFGDAFLKEN